MATLTDARDAALAPGGGGWLRRESWPHDRIRVETGVWHYNTPADMGWEDAIAEDWLACDVDGEPTQAQAQGCLFTGPPVDITDGVDPAEYIAQMRGMGAEAAEPSGADYEQAVRDVLQTDALLKVRRDIHNRARQIAAARTKGDHK